MYTLRPAGWRTFPILLGIGLAITLGGCAAVGPDHAPPEYGAPSAWQAPLPHEGKAAALGDWWSQFNDPLLSQLQQSAESGSPTLANAWAQIEKARATLANARAPGLPSANGQASVVRGTQQTDGAATARSAGLDASWELDLFGKVRRSTESAQARAQARENDWHDARTSLAAEVADTYVQYRACRLLASAYAQELASMNETASATESLVRAGLTATSDGALARASLAGTRSAALGQGAQCELLVKSLVDLTGTDEAELRNQLAQGATEVPQPSGIEVRSVPAQVLRQRPDLAARERELAATSAEIGVAQADLYPSLSLSGSIDVSAVGVAPALTSWSFGPMLSLPLFDGGRRQAAVTSARASYDAAHADWRQAVRTAMKEVEQALVRLDSTAQRTEQAELSAQEYRRYLVAAQAQWRAGSTSLLDLEASRRQSLSAQVELIGLQRDHVAYWIALYKALGGGWQPGAPATSSTPTVSAARSFP